MKAAVLAAALAVAGLSHAQAETATAVGLTLGADHLSNGSSDWQESTVRVTRTFAPRRVFDLSLGRTERFGLRDTQIGASATLPLSERLAATLDANASDTHRVLPENAIGTTLQLEFAPAWLLHAGARTTRYDAVRVNQGLLMLEHYVSSFSWSAGWRPARAFGATAHAGELRGNYYYGDRNSAGLILAGGKEAANVGSAVVLDNVRSLTLVGRHWLNREWALNYSAGHTRQGNFYNRNGISVGLQYAF